MKFGRSTEDHHLDRLFDSCGKTLLDLKLDLRLDFDLRSHRVVFPRALLRVGLPLRRLSLSFMASIQVETIIDLCKNKVRGFRLSLPLTMLDLNDFTRLVKACPHVVFEDLEFEAPDGFDLEEYMSSLLTQ